MRGRKLPIRILNWLAIMLVVVTLLSLTTYLAAPMLVSRLAPQFAERLGLETIEVSMGYPGWRELHIDRLSLVGNDWSLRGKDATIRYALPTLLSGHIESIVFESLWVSVNSATTNESDQQETADQIFPAVPFDQLRIEQLTLEFPDTGFVGTGRAELGDGVLAFSLQGIEPEPASHFNITANLSSEGIFNAHFRERDDAGGEFLAMRGALTDDTLQIAGELDIKGYVLDLGSSIAGLPAGTGVVTGQFDTQLAWPLADAFSWQDITASLPKISIEWSSTDSELELKGLTGSIEIDQGKIVALMAATVHTRFDDYDIHLTSPEDYRLTYQNSELRGKGNLDLRANNQDQTLIAELRSFSINTADGARIELDAAINASTAALQADGSFNGNLALASVEPTAGKGQFDFSGTVMVADHAYASTVGTQFNIAGDYLTAGGQLSSGVVEQAPFELQYDLKSGAGSLTVTDTISFQQPLAAAVIPAWTEIYDLDSGQIDAALKLSWQSFNEVPAELTLNLNTVAGHYDDYQANGITGDLEFTAGHIADAESWRLRESLVQLEQLNVGVPVRSLKFKVAWSGDRAQVTNASAALLGGQATATDFVYNLAAGSSDLTLALQNLDLADVLALEGDDIVGSGILNGTLPVVVNNNQVLINEGSVTAAPPGGSIRLTPSLSGPSGQPGLDFALLALKDFSYSELNTEINYAENGDLQLAVHLKGRNPAVEDGRPIHYNLNITENVPVLLESLRLQDQVTERIEAEIKK